MHFLSAAEVERLAEAIVPPYGVLVRFAAYTGLRAGEIAALRVKRLDLLCGTVRVVEAASEVGGRLITGPTKTHAERTVRLPRFLRDELAAYLASPPRDRDASCLLPRRVGHCGTTTSISGNSAQRWFARACLRRSAFTTCGTPAPRSSSPRAPIPRRSKRTLGTARSRSRWTVTGIYSPTPWST
jgi:integrase